MSERTKKILFAIFFILFSLAMGYALYWMLFRSNATPTEQAPGTEAITGNLPTAASGTANVISGQGPTTFPPGGEVPTIPGAEAQVGTRLLRDGISQALTPSPDGSGARFYNPEDGRFYRVTADGAITMLGEKQFFNVNQVSWGNESDQAILDFPDGTNIFYDFTAQRQVVLPKHWENFDFSPNDQQVAAKSIGVDESNRFLFISKPDGSEAKAIEPLGTNGDLAHVAWAPNSQIIAYSETGEPQGDGQQEILMIGQNHENFRSLIAPGQDFLPNWSPTGKQMIFSVWNTDSNNKPDLWITSGEPATMGAGRRNLHILTWADKCVWADDTNIYCGVPQDLPDNAGMQRSDFATYPDDVFHINLQSGTFQKINLPNQVHSIRQPVLNRDHSKFIFTDTETGKIYSYDIK